RVGDAAVAEHELRVVVDVRVVEERRRARDLEPRCVRLDEEERLLAVGHGRDHVHAGLSLARHEPLLAVQAPAAVAVPFGRGPAPRRAGAPPRVPRPPPPVVPARPRPAPRPPPPVPAPHPPAAGGPLCRPRHPGPLWWRPRPPPRPPPPPARKARPRR